MVALASSRALGTGVRIGVTDEGALAVASDVVGEWLQRIDLACSRFREDSDVSRVNAAAGRAVEVSQLCFEAMSVAVAVAAATDGLVDPTVGSAMIGIGYDRDFEVIRDAPGAPQPPRAAPGWQTVDLEPRARTVRIVGGAALDVGASAKALAADHAAAEAAERTGAGVLVSLGGDIAVAGAAPDGGWQVLVTDDHDARADAPGQLVGITKGGLATSSTTVRRWRRGDDDLHHIVDPRTGRPATTRLRTVSVAASSCVGANAASTAAIILDGDAVPWLEARALPARLVDATGTITYTCDWPTAGERS